MAHDPVIADLNRHLSELDEADAKAESVDEIVDEWMKDKERVSDALAEELNLPEDLHDIVVTAVVSGDWHRVTGWIEDTLRQRFDEGAEQEFDRRVEQSQRDAAEARDMSRENFDD